ncbi:MAG TPA: Rrf2 family transcriptional regulator [Dehalococcoidia bacterium]|nr:Rrf2 family transcriptional regulator [Dehalococcoidia bacterium]
MKLSTRGDYAVRALLELSTADADNAIPLGELAERTRIPAKYLEQILMRLRTARVVRGKRGARGGYMLARDPHRVTVGEVIRAMEGPLAPSLCASQTAHTACPAYRCPSEDACVMRGLWAEVRDAIAGIVDHTTFGDLAARTREQQAAAREMYYI